MSMTPFEKAAIFTIINSMRQQLDGLQTLLAASGGGAKEAAHKVHGGNEEPLTDSRYTSEEEDEQLAKQFGLKDQAALKSDAEKLARSAEDTFSKAWDEAKAEATAEADQILQGSEAQ